ncbi:TetR/AcrR family transcriptional regulator [Psychromonas aquatilis]|uniref:TetR/AcrR family transcriptional regulator n=1 Tax=Psychromonas aquatilis TaxID=2005072 RepID=A0ABU9GLX1_9GAMM
MQPRKQHLIETALSLFSEKGYHATGIDLILATSGVSKATLYKHFRSKEELILAALKNRDQQILGTLQTALSNADKTQLSVIEVVFDHLHNWFNSEAFFGCNFINASAEYNDPNSPITLYIIEHKQNVIKVIAEQLATTNCDDQANKVQQIGLLIEGAIVMAHTQGEKNAALIAKEMAKTLLKIK